ncbi:MAG TPA: ATP-grasp domain-containing protein [Gemmatimonadaceae bacterium]|nr:ATP-grasp domain-containing protein [Gemmatimonadaceae bacterium]
MPNVSPHVLVAGVSTRAAADSAALAGYRVTALDAFGDLDQSAGVRGLSMAREFGVPFTAASAARVAEAIECDAVAYVANFENHPRAVRALARGRTLLGNPPEVLRRVRDPFLLAEVFEHRGVRAPAVIPTAGVIPSGAPKARSRGIALIPAEGPLDREDGDSSTPAATRPPLGLTEWLLKPRRSGGGHGIRAWKPGAPIPRASYVQERIEGIPGSVAFVAARGRAVPLCLTRQIIGDPAFGATGFQYCGNIVTGPHDREFGVDSRLAHAAVTLANLLTEEFGLVGVNGIDFVMHDDTPFPIEVNPRYSASMELVERADGLSVFAAHAMACIDGSVPSFDFREATTRRGLATGKSIVYARHDVVCDDTAAWLANPAVRDVPHPGERIAAGHPVCTVFADGADVAECYAALAQEARLIYETLDARTAAGV